MERRSPLKFFFAVLLANLVTAALLGGGFYYENAQNQEREASLREHQVAADFDAEMTARSSSFPPSERERAAIYDALQSVRELRTATSIGLSLTDYNGRVLDSGIKMERALAMVRDGVGKDSLRRSFQAYKDADSLWTASIGKETMLDFAAGIKSELFTTYGIPGTLSHDKSEGLFDVKFNQKDRDLILQKVWEEAGNRVAASETIILKQGIPKQ